MNKMILILNSKKRHLDAANNSDESDRESVRESRSDDDERITKKVEAPKRKMQSEAGKGDMKQPTKKSSKTLVKTISGKTFVDQKELPSILAQSQSNYSQQPQSQSQSQSQSQKINTNSASYKYMYGDDDDDDYDDLFGK
jgi:hypothetical protein